MDPIVPNWKLQKKSKIYMTWVFFSLMDLSSTEEDYCQFFLFICSFQLQSMSIRLFIIFTLNWLELDFHS